MAFIIFKYSWKSTGPTETFEKDETVFTNSAVEADGPSGSCSPRPGSQRGCSWNGGGSGSDSTLYEWLPFPGLLPSPAPLLSKSGQPAWEGKGFRGASHPALTQGKCTSVHHLVMADSS